MNETAVCHKCHRVYGVQSGHECEEDIAQVPMTPERLEEIIDLFGGEPTSATLAAATRAAVGAWRAQVDRIANALASLAEENTGLRREYATLKQAYDNAVLAHGEDTRQLSISAWKLDAADHKNLLIRTDLEITRQRLYGALGALRQLTFSPDGLPDTWPRPELVATILAGKAPLPYQPGYERKKP